MRSALTDVLTAIISDLHGNWPALSVAIADAEQRGARRFVCLGDMVGYGARPRECVREVMRLVAPARAGSPVPPASPAATSGPGEFVADGASRPASDSGPEGRLPGLCLLGNHEHAMMNSAEDFNPSARQAIEWTRGAFEPLAGSSGAEDVDDDLALWDFLGQLRPLATEGEVMYAHGSPRDPVREYMLPRDIRDTAKMRANFARMDARVCFVGHSHVPAIYYEDGRFYRPRTTEGPYDLGRDLATTKAIVNVGSVGQPRDGDPRLSYALFDGQHLTFVRAVYDVETAQAEIRAVPELPDYLAERLALGR